MFSIVWMWVMITVILFGLAALSLRVFVEAMQLMGVILFGFAVLIIVAGCVGVLPS